jgi:hypothetical protein
MGGANCLARIFDESDVVMLSAGGRSPCGLGLCEGGTVLGA